MNFYIISVATIYFMYIVTLSIHILISFKICRGLSYLFMLYKQNLVKEKLYIYYFCLKNDIKKAFPNFLLFIAWIILCFHFQILKELLCIFCAVLIDHYCRKPEKNHVLYLSNLHVGYGAAVAYYKNYLEMTLTERFSERIDKFSSENMIKLRKKLFILVPRTCKVYSYLDSIERENIERCRELPDEKISHGGIKDRTYNITIYNINGLRMAVEFAQPLKAFYSFKEKGIYTINDMEYQREIFSETLKNFLKEDPYKYFEIVEYNDSVENIDDVLVKAYHGYSKSYDIETV